MISPFQPAGSTAPQPPDPSTTTSTAPSQGSPTEDMFLQLLVTQIKNQDPLNPADGVQFLGELAQFSELDQVIAIRQDLDQMGGAASPAPGGNTTPPASTQQI